MGETYLSTEDVKAIKELRRNFDREMTKLFLQARRSGAVPDGATSIELGRCVMVIAAENFAPMSDFGRKMLKNLRHFV